jgi:hypothetical protein
MLTKAQKRLASHTVLAVSALLLGSLLTACGDDSKDPAAASPGTVTSASPSAGGGFEQALAFAQCMRDNGVPDYPDPQQQGGKVQFNGGDMNSPAAQKAVEACRDKMPQGNAGGPNGGAAIDSAKVTAWVKCMRENGLPKFPDPDVSGNTITVPVGDSGIKPDSPEFQKAQSACMSTYPGGMLKLEGPGPN